MEKHPPEVKESGTRVFEGRILTLEVDTVRLANGHQTVREVVRHPGAVVMLPVDAEGNVMLVKQYRYPVDCAILELPAGKLDGNESLEACAVRELAEEIGMRPGELELLGSFYAAPGFSDEHLVAFMARRLEPAAPVAGDPDECIEVVVLSLPELLSAICRGDIRDAKTLATLALAQAAGLLETFSSGS
jgi:ADP-ribose pyrophosphatase